MSKGSSVDRNIVITFGNHLTNEFIKLSQKINNMIPSKILLNEIDEIPHLTLYMAKYPKKNIAKVLNKLNKILSSIKCFELIFNSKSCQSSGTVFIEAVVTNELYKLHEDLVNILNPLREGLYNEDELKLSGLTKKKKISLINYGMRAVKGDYVPHVSIARINPEQYSQSVLKILPHKISYKTIVEKISFVIRGHDGTCKKILNTFKLKG